MAQTVVSCSISAALFRCLNDVAAKTHRTRSGLIADLLQEFLPLIDLQSAEPIRLIGRERQE